jgi:hypothetical protein
MPPAGAALHLLSELANCLADCCGAGSPEDDPGMRGRTARNGMRVTSPCHSMADGLEQQQSILLGLLVPVLAHSSLVGVPEQAENLPFCFGTGEVSGSSQQLEVTLVRLPQHGGNVFCLGHGGGGGGKQIGDVKCLSTPAVQLKENYMSTCASRSFSLHICKQRFWQRPITY